MRGDIIPHTYYLFVRIIVDFIFSTLKAVTFKYAVLVVQLKNMIIDTYFLEYVSKFFWENVTWKQWKQTVTNQLCWKWDKNCIYDVSNRISLSRPYTKIFVYDRCSICAEFDALLNKYTLSVLLQHCFLFVIVAFGFHSKR